MNVFSALRRYPRILLCIIAAALYLPSLFGDFVYDDRALTILENPALHGEASLGEIFSWDRPLREFTYMLDHALWGFHPCGYHLQNIFWHIANALLLYALFLHFGVPRLAFWGTLIFVVHPVNTESVAWISGRKELLCFFFEIAACLFFIKTLGQTGKSARISYSLCLICGLLALLSKQVAVALPLLLGLSGWYSQQQHQTKTSIKKYFKLLFPPSVLVVLFIVFKFSIFQQLLFTQESGTFYDPAARDVAYTPLSALLTPCATFLKSIGLFFWPRDLTVERVFAPVEQITDPRWIAGAILGVFAVFFAWKKRMADPACSFGIAWFIITWLPVCGGAPVGYLLADRYLYIPYAGFSLVAIRMLQSFWPKPETNIQRFSFGFLLLIVFSLSIRTWIRIADWHDEITLWQSALRIQPDNTQAWSALGLAYADAGRDEEAFRAWDHSLSLDRDQPRVWVNRGNTEKRRGNLPKAEQCYRKALELFPDYGAAHFNLALLLEQQNQPDAALREYQIAAETLYHRLNTDSRKGLAHYHIAWILYQKGELEAARYHLQHALQSTTTYPPIYVLLGILNQSDPSTARRAFETAIRLDPHYAEAYFNLGLLEWQTGDPKKAEQLWSKAVQFDSNLSTPIGAIRKNHPAGDKN